MSIKSKTEADVVIKIDYVITDIVLLIQRMINLFAVKRLTVASMNMVW